jgi:hypothetical protein
LAFHGRAPLWASASLACLAAAKRGKFWAGQLSPQQAPRHSVRFPGESDTYRTARNELLEAEMSLRKQIESVAELRRSSQ